jgi:transcriptional regulator with GAF, ATPase, and Fis domain
MLPDEEGKHLRVHALDYPDSKGIITEGAAVRMGVKRTTLISRMKKLGIHPRAVL